MGYLQKLWVLTFLISGLFMGLLGLEHFYASAVDPSFDLCLIGEGWGCREVINHPYSRFALLPIAVWGLAVYAVGLRLGPKTWHRTSFRLFSLLLVIFLCTLSTFYLYIIRRDLVDLCPLCLGSHASHLVLLALLITGLIRIPSRPDSEGVQVTKFLSPPLIILLVGYSLTSWTMQRSGQAGLVRSATVGSLIASVLHEDFNRHFPAHGYQLITGDGNAPQTLTIIGSLACRHCRDLIGSVKKLPDNMQRNTGIYFLPYPVAAACNPRAAGQAEPHPERCVLAERTLSAQKNGNFWPWFEEINDAPGRMLRSLRDTSPGNNTWTETLTAHINALNEIPMDSIPFVLWDGRRLPSAVSSVALPDLLSYLIEIEKSRKPSALDDDCLDC